MLQYPYKVSVCIFVYNHEKYISDCLMSVLSQNIDGGIEILVGDDCSTDNTSSVIFGLMDKYPNQITYFRHGENMGAHDNVKFLVDKAQGEYIAHLDGDDYWLPGKLSAQMEFIVNNISTSAVFNNSVVVNDKKEAAGFFNNKIPEHFDLTYLLEKGNFLHHSTLLYRACYKKTVLDMPKEYLDYDIHMGMAMVGDLGFVNEVNGCYRLGSTSSLIKVMPEKVFILYTDAIVSVEHIATQSAMAHLLVSVILSSIKLNNVKFLKTWLDKYKSNIGLFVFGKSAVLLFKRVVYFLYKKIFIYNKSLNILYPRGK